MFSVTSSRLFSTAFMFFSIWLTASIVPAQAAKPPIEIIAFKVPKIAQPQAIQVLGQLQAKQSVDLSANVTDTIQAIHFKEGETVRQSQLLVELNSAEELARLEEAKALAEEAWLQYKRVKEVVGRGSVTESMVDEKYREWQTAVAQRKVIQAQVADRRIYAPFTGQLGFTSLSVGALVSPGTQIVSLDNTLEMKLDLLVPVRFLQNLTLGQEVTIRSSAYPNETFRGQISAISPRVEANVRMVKVRALIDNPDQRLKTNMLVEAEMALPTQAQLQVPNSAVLMLGDKEFIYRLLPSKENSGLYEAQKIEVETGRIGASYTEVLTGLKEGDLVVSQGVMRVNSKQPIKIKAMQDQQSQEALLKASDTQTTQEP